MTDSSSNLAGPSGRRNDLLGSNEIETIDGLRSDETAVLHNDVRGNATSGAATGGNGGPPDGELVSGQNANSAMDSAGHDPLNVEPVRVFGGGDHDGSRVLDLEGVDAVHGIGSRKAISGAIGRQVAGKGARVEHGSEGREGDDRENNIPNSHFAKPTAGIDPEQVDTFVFSRWMKVTASLLVLVIAAAMAFAVFEPIQVLPRLRLAPGYSMDDQNGEAFTSETVRGAVTLYTIASADCEDTCDELAETMAIVRDTAAAEVDLGDVDLQLVTIVLDASPTTGDLGDAARRFGADGEEWIVVGGDEGDLRNVVANGFGRYFETEPDGGVRFDAGFVLVDGAGVIRGDYRYQTLADDADKLVRHINILASELRYSSGSAAVAYEAAHLFLCYP